LIIIRLISCIRTISESLISNIQINWPSRRLSISFNHKWMEVKEMLFSSPWMILHKIILDVLLNFSTSMTIVDHTSLVMAAPSSQKRIMTIIPSELTKMISLWPQPTRILWSRVPQVSERIRAQNSIRRIMPPWLILLTNSLQDQDWSQRHQMTLMKSVGSNLQMMKPNIHRIRKERMIYNNIKNNKIFIIKAIRIPIIIKALTGFNMKEPLQRLVLTFIMIAACLINTVRHNMTSSERRSKLPPKGIKRGLKRHQRYLQYLSIISIQTSSIKAKCKQQLHLKRTRTCSTTSTRRWKPVTQGIWNLIKLNKLITSNWFTSQAINNMMDLIKASTKDTSSHSKR